MSNQSFTFPPPPPAPPQTVQSYPTYPKPQQRPQYHASNASKDVRGHHEYGRGNHRGAPRARNFGLSHPSRGHGGYPAGGSSRTVPQNGGYNMQGSHQRGGAYPLPNYPSMQLPQYPANVGQDYGRRSIDYAGQPIASQPQQPGYPAYQQNPQPYHQGPLSYNSHDYVSQSPNLQCVNQGFQSSRGLISGSSDRPPMMGPPIRMGFNEGRQDHQPQTLPQPTASGTISFENGSLVDNRSPYRQNSPSSIQPGRHDSPNPFNGHRGRGQKRRYGEAPGRQRHHNSRPHAAPAVPSFGSALLLPVKPPVVQDHVRKPRKKKRKHNQLGLTPKAEEHESSEEEEDDAGEEARLATAVVGSNSASELLQFEYKGRTSTLQSSSDVMAWIEERKKRFPTKARAVEAAERKRQQDQAQRAVHQARREAQDKQRTEAKENERLKIEAERKRQRPTEDNEDAATMAKRKVEKLRKRLEKEEKRVAKAEAKASRIEIGGDQSIGERNGIHGAKKRKRSHNAGSDNSGVKHLNAAGLNDNGQDCVDGLAVKAESVVQNHKGAIVMNDDDFGSNTALDKSWDPIHQVADPLTPTSQPPAPDDTVAPQDNLPEASKDVTEQGTQDVESSASDTSSDISSADSEDLTSSSGSSSSGLDSGDDAPEEETSRRNGPERVSPPKREKPKQICRVYLKNGRCKRGDSCMYRHELPERGSGTASRKDDKKTHERTGRVSLHQRLVEQEKEKEDHEILNAIIRLGEKGLLHEDAPKDAPDSKAI